MTSTLIIIALFAYVVSKITTYSRGYAILNRSLACSGEVYKNKPLHERRRIARKYDVYFDEELGRAIHSRRADGTPCC